MYKMHTFNMSAEPDLTWNGANLVLVLARFCCRCVCGCGSLWLGRHTDSSYLPWWWTCWHISSPIGHTHYPSFHSKTLADIFLFWLIDKQTTPWPMPILFVASGLKAKTVEHLRCVHGPSILLICMSDCFHWCGKTQPKINSLSGKGIRYNDAIYRWMKASTDLSSYTTNLNRSIGHAITIYTATGR